MKRFFKLFFICVCFFISLATNAYGIDWHAQEFKTTQQVINPTTKHQEELTINFDIESNAISAANNQKFEISATNSQKNSHNGTLDKTATQSKLLQQIFTANYNKTLYSSSHKISSYLKNEICTRAP